MNTLNTYVLIFSLNEIASTKSFHPGRSSDMKQHMPIKKLLVLKAVKNEIQVTISRSHKIHEKDCAVSL